MVGFGGGPLFAEVLSFDPYLESPKSLGAAGAYRSIADDPSTFYTNPAGLARHQENRFVFLSGDVVPTGLGGGKKDYVVQAGLLDGKTEKPLAWGFSFAGVHTDTNRKDFYTFDSAFNFENFFLIGLSNSIINFGTRTRTEDQWAYSLGVGIMAFLHEFVSVGVQAQNLLNSAKDANHLDRRFSLGVSLNLLNLRWAVDMERNQDEGEQVLQTGIEYRFLPGLFLRSGYFRNLTTKEHGYTMGTSSELANRFFVDLGYLNQLKSSFSLLSFGFRVRL